MYNNVHVSLPTLLSTSFTELLQRNRLTAIPSKIIFQLQPTQKKVQLDETHFKKIMYYTNETKLVDTS